MEEEKRNDKLPFEEALDKTGFGLYNYIITGIAGFANISFVFMAFSATVIVPASACDLATTTGQQGAMVAAPYVGTIFGNIVWGYLADTRGRRKMLMISLISAACMNSIASLSVNWIMLMAFQFLTLLLASGQYTIGMTIACESMPKKRRNMVLLIISSIYLIAQGIMSVLGIPILPLTFSHYLSGLGIYWTSWRTLMLVYSVPSIITVLCLWTMKESPKYVLGKGDEEGALEILRFIHRLNKGRSKELEVTGILMEIDNTGEKSPARDQILTVFKQPYLKPTILISILYVLLQGSGAFMQWLPTISNQFFQTLQTGEGTGLNLCGMISAGLDAPPVDDAVPCAIDENALLVVLVVCIIQSGLNALLPVLVEFTGRRNTAIMCSASFGICGILVNIVPNAVGSAVLFIGFLMGILLIGIYAAMTVAIFPTKVRAVALAVVVTGGQIASFAVIQVVNYLLVNSCELGFYLFAALFTTSAGVLMLLPDDRLLANENKEKAADEELTS